MPTKSIIFVIVSFVIAIGTALPAAARWGGGGGAVDGVCGSANGQTLASAPISGLCQTGSATPVSGGGPWAWSCFGSANGSNSNCEAYAESDPPAAGRTRSGVPLPAGWALQISDIFGTGAGNTVTNYTQLHSRYNEGQFYNVDTSGLVKIPNVVINGEQQTYQHFETAIAFFADHIAIQGRGQPNGTIQSAEMVSKNTPLSFCVEARYQIPSAPGSWPAFWWYGSTAQNTNSEIDVEQPVTLNGSQGVGDVSLYNHPSAGTIAIANPNFTTRWMTYYSATDFSAAPHYYTACYNDTTRTVSRWIDAGLIYTSTNWKWSGANPNTIVNLAVGGSWPGNLSDPTAYSGDLDIYSIEYYGP